MSSIYCILDHYLVLFITAYDANDLGRESASG